MILIHRATPLVIALCIAAGFFAVTRLSVNPIVGLGVTSAIVFALLSRLVGLRPRTFQYWYFVGTPVLFLLSACGLYLFLEYPAERVALVLVCALLVFFFGEHLFHYVHIPASYQAYAIEHLSLVLNVLTVFFLGAFGFGLRMFLQLPLLALAAGFFLAIAFVVYGTLWVSKVEHRNAWPYALAGAVLTTELFSVITFLPTGFYTNAAVLALFFYLFLGFTRAHFVDQLTPSVSRRYLLIGSFLFATIVGTARWV